ncbi:hypothetical protein TNCV_1334731 [Trichonephila clavipes]|nr:hypothetical protein TNCV_1334731 [Trichonephila clavipes]
MATPSLRVPKKNQVFPSPPRTATPSGTINNYDMGWRLALRAICPATDPFWLLRITVLENKVRTRFSPPRTLSDLETTVHEELVRERERIPINFVQDIYLSISHRMQTVLQVKGGRTFH